MLVFVEIASRQLCQHLRSIMGQTKRKKVVLSSWKALPKTADAALYHYELLTDSRQQRRTSCIGGRRTMVDACLLLPPMGGEVGGGGS